MSRSNRIKQLNILSSWAPDFGSGTSAVCITVQQCGRGLKYLQEQFHNAGAPLGSNLRGLPFWKHFVDVRRLPTHGECMVHAKASSVNVGDDGTGLWSSVSFALEHFEMLFHGLGD